ncbi:MAG TPA: amino acid adenylation domain-containing protein [Pyrinomonadaceae bacterium]|nr:amino acid adenylation domain-containing protein [Pyrinomonadaceae bacterium]
MAQRAYDDLPPSISTLVELLRYRANQQPDRVAYTFLVDGERDAEQITYGELDRQARAIGAELQARRAEGARALLLYPPGLNYVAAFFGCLYAQAIAVPAYPPRLNRTLSRLKAITADAQASIVLGTTQTLSHLKRGIAQAPELEQLTWLSTDDLSPEMAGEWREPSVGGQALAFLQYTSGSTSTPKGVMVSHSNLLSNERIIKHAFEHTAEAVIVGWLPLYHDMGLIGNVLNPLYICAPAILMSPVAFLQKPARWLQAISDYKATTSGGPNFAYDLCVRKITPEQRETLDLSSWQIAFNGAEPVRRHTLEKFAETFAPHGFKRRAFMPVYGLAEGTLFVSGAAKNEEFVARAFETEALQANRVVEVGDEASGGQHLVSSGCAGVEQEVVVVDPESLLRCAEGRVGEIWVRGASVAQGYWRREEETERTFRAFLADTGAGPFLRTGDLGFLQGVELFVTGRLKDLIIIRGRNLYPQDIELTVEQSSPALKLGGGAAFAIDVDGEERLIIVQEIEREHRQHDPEDIFKAIREKVGEQHEVEIYAIALIKPGSIPKTSSGKIQRHACRQQFLANSLELIHASVTGQTTAQTVSTNNTDAPQIASDVPAEINERELSQAVRQQIGAAVASALRVSPNDIPSDRSFSSLGIDSLKAVEIMDALGQQFGVTLSPTILFEAPTISELTEHLCQEHKTALTAFMQARAKQTANGATKSSGVEATFEPEGGGTKAEGVSTPALVETFDARDEDIAIIGMGCRLPQSPDLASFWKLLSDGRDAITEVPRERWDWRDFYDANPDAEKKTYSRWGGFLDDLDKFDPLFFNISPREARLIDPQQRIFLEVAWETLEHAGYSAAKLAEQEVGVFVGSSNNGYYRRIESALTIADHTAGVGNQNAVIANRVSYFLNLHGPSLLVDTMCSSSLVALHLACQSLRQGECTMALAGGVNVLLSPEYFVAMSRMKAHSPDGRCKTFDQSANGIVIGEGAGSVLLKPLSRAVADGDQIFAVIKGSAVNHGGQANGLTAPNPKAHARLVAKAFAAAGVSADTISYVEAHGTGTALGDPIEIEGLTKAFRQHTERTEFCSIGSVKTNIGHLEPAAGISGLIKIILSMQHRQLPASLHFERANGIIPFAETPFKVNTELCEWRAEGARRACISSFGIGGANAHVIVEEAPARTRPENETERPVHLLTLSAKTGSALSALANRYHALLQNDQTLSLSDLCFTANTGRTHFAHRLTVISESTAELISQLADFAAGQSKASAARIRQRQATSDERLPVTFLFTGQGAQYADMGRRLYETQPTFRGALERCDEVLRAHLPTPLLSVLYAGGDAERAERLNETVYTQPALFALEFALCELWRSWGIVPDAVVGHSIGEYTAACVAGVLGLEDALKLVAARGRLMQTLPQDGAMAVAFTDEARCAEVIAGYGETLSIAAVNSPQSVVISGARAALQEVSERLSRSGVALRPLNTSHAFHSPLMNPILDEFERVASEVRCAPARIPLVSNLDGRRWEASFVPDAAYWRRHLRETVRFSASLETLAAGGRQIFLEVGPHPALVAAGKRCLPKDAAVWLHSLQQGTDDWQTLLGSLAELYLHGAEVDWKGFDRDYPRSLIALPTYPFERRRCWVDAPVQSVAAVAPQVAEATTHAQAIGQPHADSTSHGRTIHIETNERPVESPLCMNTNTTPKGHSTPMPEVTNHSVAESLSAVPLSPTRQERLLSFMSEKIAGLLQIDVSEIDVHASFLEMGADSIVLIEAIQAIENIFDLKLSVRQFFEDLTSIHALTVYLDEVLPPEAFPAQTTAALPGTPQSTVEAAVGNGAAASLTAGGNGASEINAEKAIHVTAAHPSPALEHAAVTPQAVHTIAPQVTPVPVAPTLYAAPVRVERDAPHGTRGETSLERIVSQQLEAIQQHSRLMAQQLEILGQQQPQVFHPLPVTPEALPDHLGNGHGHSNGNGNGHSNGNGNGHGKSEGLQETTLTSQSSTEAQNGHGGQGQVAPQLSAPTAAVVEVLPVVKGAQPEKAAREAYVPYKPVQPGQAGGHNARQQEHLAALIERYTRRTRKSKQLTEEARPFCADSRAMIGFRYSIKEMLYPITAASSEGCRITDVDGNVYIDLTMGMGVHLFGHGAPFLSEALTAQLASGIHIGPRSHLVGEVSRLFCELTGAERAAFTNSGTEAVATALRLARTATGRTKIVIFSGSYHGHFDGTLARNQMIDGKPVSVPLAPGVQPCIAEDILVLEYGTPEALEAIRAHADELAAVLVEPVQGRRPEFQPREFLQQLRRLTEETNVPLIFDEMITGFRVHLGGSQAWFGVKADIATYGKIVGGGMPIGVVAGKAQYLDGIDGGMWEYGDKSFPKADTTFFGGTFCQHPLTMATAHATLTYLKQQGAGLQAELNERTTRFADALNEWFEREALPIKIVHFGSVFRFAYSGNMDLLFYHLLERGVYVWEWRNCFLSTAHTDEDIAYIIEAVKGAIGDMRDGGFLPPSPTQPNGNGASDSGSTHNSPSPASTSGVAGATGAHPGVNTATDAAVVPLLESQKQLWLLAQMGEDASAAYNETALVRLTGALKRELLRAALEQVVDRHEALRTVISSDGTTQEVRPRARVELPLVTFDAPDATARAAEANAWLIAESRRAFNFTEQPPVRFHCLQLESEVHLLVVTIHHIVVDGLSLALLLQEMSVIYSALARGGAAKLDEPMQFREYVAFQQRQLEAGVWKEQERFWLEKFSTAIPALELPTDHTRPPLKTFRGRRQTLRVEPELYARLVQLSKQQMCTPFVMLLAAYMTLLHRITNQDDILVGIPVWGRTFAGAQPLVGYCVHLAPLYSRADGNPTFAEHLRALRTVWLEAYEHQDYPFAHLVNRLVREQKLSSDPSRTPLVSAVFNMDKLTVSEMHGLAAEILSPPVSYTKFDLSLNITEINGELRLDAEHNLDLFDEETIKRLLGQFKTLLQSIVADPHERLRRLPLLDEAERREMLVEWNATHQEFPRESCLQQLFEAQARRTPEQVAVVCRDKQLSYAELDARANRLARHLRDLGVGREMLVGVACERGIEMMVGLLGILKAGGAYVPVDLQYPQERIALMLKDSGIEVLLTEHSLLDSLSAHDARTICLDTDAELIGRASSEPLPPTADADNLAYVIYTSGSSGRPKGVQISHRAVVNLLCSMRREPGLEADDSLLAVTTLSFDIAALELFLPLITGARLVIAPRDAASDGLLLGELLAGSGANVMQATPSTWRMLLEAGWTGDPRLKVLCGGEALPADLAATLSARVASLWNVYGPTETTIWSTVDQTDGTDESISIGRPIANTELYILDRELQPAPIGVSGDLYIAGVGLARGYLHRPELTGERFVPDPFAQQPGRRMYQTGDVARYRRDGRVELLGRSDQQVKVRGFRIELGEIETALGRHTAVGQCAVVVRERSGDKQLVAYVTLRGEEAATSSDELRRFLEQSLPAYMVPALFVVLEQLPLTPNGKVNRQALPQPTETSLAAGRVYVAPQTPLEEKLAALFAEVLGLARVGRDDDFFRTGGHSLLATRLASRVRNEFGVEMPLRRFFESPTVGLLAAHIEQTQGGAAHSVHSELPGELPKITRIPREGELPLSFAQQRLWFLNQLSPASPFYNMNGVVRLTGELKVAALERAFTEVCARHETLRTRFKSVANQPVQFILAPQDFELACEDFSQLDKEAREPAVTARIRSVGERPFDLEHDELLRAHLFRLAPDEHLLLVSLHHIIADGWSLGVLVREVAAVYEASLTGAPSPLSALPVQYVDFAHWQREWLQGEELEAQLAYWRRQLGGTLPLPTIQTDLPRPAVLKHHGAQLTQQLDADLVSSLKELGSAAGATEFMTLVAVFNALLQRHNNSREIILGTDIANRRHAELESLIGFFVNLLVLRTDMTGDPTLHELLARVKEVCLSAYAHQDVPFDRLVTELSGERKLNQTPLFQVLFVLQNAPMPELELAGLRLRSEEMEAGSAKFDVAVFVEELADGGRVVRWQYSTELFREKRIRELAAGYERMLRAWTERPDEKLSRLQLRTQSELDAQAAEEKSLQAAKGSKLRSVRRKALTIAVTELVKTGYLSDTAKMPLVIQPATDEVDLAGWAKNNHALLQSQLHAHGALLFRNFKINSVAEFERSAAAMCPELFADYGDLPRAEVGKKVYGSTPYPADKAILFHNESSHLQSWPVRIWFHCVQAATEGGETPIVDCRRVYQILRPELRERFERRGLMYVRNYTEGLDVSWERFFGTDSREEVERQCLAAGIEFEWRRENDLQTRKRTAAVRRHPQTGEVVFFNQVQLHHISCLDAAVRESLLSLFKADELPRNVYYGDGKPIEDEVMAEVGAAYERAVVAFPWQPGDILMLDNMLVAHGRYSYTGQRKIVVAMGEMIHENALT